MSVFLNTDLALSSRLECEVGEHEGGVDGEDGGARLLGVGEDGVRRPVEGLEPLHPPVKHLQQTTAVMLRCRGGAGVQTLYGHASCGTRSEAAVYLLIMG